MSLILIFFRKEGDVVQTNSAFPGLVVEHSADGQNSWKSGNIANPGSHVYLRTRYDFKIYFFS